MIINHAALYKKIFIWPPYLKMVANKKSIITYSEYGGEMKQTFNSLNFSVNSIVLKITFVAFLRYNLPFIMTALLSCFLNEIP